MGTFHAKCDGNMRKAGVRNERVETCLLRRPTKYIGALLPTWRNWQTRQTQNLVLVRVCGFDPLRRHQDFPVAPARHKPSCLPGNGFGKSGTWLSELRTWARVFLLFFCWWPQFFRNLRVIWHVM